MTRPASKPSEVVDGVEGAHHGDAQAVGADKGGDDDHGQREHDRLVEARHDLGRA
jgi:hypothetical protein